jgi:hypothetical protein
MKDKLTRLLHRIGHRGAFLLFLSLLDFLYGYSLLAIPRQQWQGVLPMQVWGWIWIAGGFICLIGATLKHDRIPFAAAATLKAGWATAWVKIWLFDPNTKLAWVSVAVWSAFSALVVIVSTWPEVRRHTRVEIVTKDGIDVPVIQRNDVSDENHSL